MVNNLHHKVQRHGHAIIEVLEVGEVMEIVHPNALIIVHIKDHKKGG